jgi:tetratricopeptide (TPR) repeat protein
MMSIRTGLGYALMIACLVPVALLSQSSDDAAAQLSAEGRQALASGHFDQAQAAFEKLAKLEPSIAEVHATLAAIYFKQREYDQTIREIRTAQKLKPGLPRLDSLMGLSLAELGRYDDALPNLEKGFKQTGDPAGRRMCGLQLLRVYTGLNRDADAVETALELNKLYPNDPEILYHTGRIYGNYAYVTMEKLHDTAPNSVWMLQAQGEANESQKNYDAAIIAFNHVLEIDPNRPGIHYRLGRIYLSRFHDAQKPADRDTALREFEAELAVDPGNGNAAYEIGTLQASSGNLDEAAKRYSQVLDRYPDFEEALVGLAGVNLENQKPADAVPLLKQATKLRPDDEVAWYRLAQAEHATGDRDAQSKALAEFQRLHQTTPVTLRKPNEADEITPQTIGATDNP